jgi:hypothetical protein
MSDSKYCEDCRWFVDGHDFYMPFDRCTNSVAVERHTTPNLVRKTTQMARCIEARDVDGACGVPGKLFELSQEITPYQVSILRSLWKNLVGKRDNGDPINLDPPWRVDLRDKDDIR